MLIMVMVETQCWLLVVPYDHWMAVEELVWKVEAGRRGCVKSSDPNSVRFSTEKLQNKRTMK